MPNFYPREPEIQGISLKVIKDITVCHTVTSIDGKVTGEFLNRPECESATEIYYEMNREYREINYRFFDNTL